MEYIVYQTQSSNIKDLINELTSIFSIKDIEYEKHEELLILTANTTEEPKIIYIEFEEPLRIKNYKKVLQCLNLLYKDENDKRLFYRLKRNIENNNIRIGLLSTLNNQDLKKKIEPLINIENIEVKEVKTLTFIFYCQKEKKEKFLEVSREFNIKKLLYIPFVNSINTNSTLENENILFIGEILKEYQKEFLTILEEVGVNIEELSFIESSFFSHQNKII